MMKKSLFIILLILCSWGACPVLHAQIYTTSSTTYHSTTALPISAFRSTSSYSSISISYSTAPMRVATGSVSTVASQLSGGVLADEGYYTENVLRGPRKLGGIGGGGIAPPDTNPAPIGEGWDVALLLALLCVGYVVRRYLTLKQVNDK
jgi:hypothetical protein